MSSILFKRSTLLAAICLLSVVYCIPKYKDCLECFYEHRNDNSYFCKSTSKCLPQQSTMCAQKDILTSYDQCVNGIEVCENMKFNTSTFQGTYEFDKTLVMGFGCYMEMSRELNGSWGELYVQPMQEKDQQMLLLFDDDDVEAKDAGQKLVEYKVGMQYADNGWKTKRVFIANRDDRSFASFKYVYQSAIKLNSIIGGVVLSSAMLVLSS